MNPLHRDILYNLLKFDRVYWFEDDPEEGKVGIIDNEDKERYFLSDDAHSECMKKNRWFPQVRGNFIIRNMILDFDGGYVRFDLYTGGGDASDYDVEF